MPAFVLVSGPFTDGRVWSGVAASLRRSGARAHPVTLSRRPDAGLPAHIADVVRVLDALDGEAVLVGHDYAIHPVLGAADRRPDRVARVVHLDAGLPRHGDAALALVPDPAVHELLGAGGEPGPVPPPRPEEWRRWGSVAGLSPGHLRWLTRLAAPQPPRTLTEPLRLTGAAAALPATGILCTAGGTTLDAVRELVRSGLPQYQGLADPRVRFLELATGHWPMLSCPEGLAEVLLRAAAGEGQRLTAPEGEPPFLRPFPIEVPERPRVRTGRVDLYLPEAGDGPGPWPAVLFVPGGPLPPPGQVPGPRDWPLFRGYARCAAALGAVGAVVEHRLHGLGDYPRAAEDVAAAVALLRGDPRVDPERIAVWLFSGAGLLAADWIGAPPARLRCLALTYPVLAPLPGWAAVAPRFRPVGAVRTGGGTAPPLVLVRAGLESPAVAATVAGFTAAAVAAGAPLEVVDVPRGGHGFETGDPTDEVREAVTRSLRAVLAHLEP